ncbi:MAG: hypothetical protein R3E89_10660 [Thiolinea sp.]
MLEQHDVVLVEQQLFVLDIDHEIRIGLIKVMDRDVIQGLGCLEQPVLDRDFSRAGWANRIRIRFDDWTSLCKR